MRSLTITKSWRRNSPNWTFFLSFLSLSCPQSIILAREVKCCWYLPSLSFRLKLRILSPRIPHILRSIEAVKKVLWENRGRQDSQIDAELAKKCQKNAARRPMNEISGIFALNLTRPWRNISNSLSPRTCLISDNVTHTVQGGTPYGN